MKISTLSQQPNAIFDKGHVKGKDSNQQTLNNSKISTEEIVKEVEEKSDKEDIKKKLVDLAAKLNSEMSLLNTSIKFGYSDDIDSMYLNVIDTKSKKVIRQMPSEEAIKLMSKMREFVGMLFDKKG